MIRRFFIAVTNIRELIYNLRRFILAHDVGGSTPWLADSIVWGNDEAGYHGQRLW